MDDITKKVINDPDFIVSPRHDNSIQKWSAAQKDEKERQTPEEIAKAERSKLQRTARMLHMPVEDVEEVRDEALQQLREELEDMR